VQVAAAACREPLNHSFLSLEATTVNKHNPPVRGQTMRAIAIREFGGVDVLRLVDLPDPLAEAARAQARLESAEQFGKIVLRLAE
jgi:hypothetical protein